MNHQCFTIPVLFLMGIAALQAGVRGPYDYYGYAPTQAYPAPTNQRQQATPAELLQQRLYELRDFLAKGGGQDPLALGVFIEEQITPHFNFERMAQWVAGKRFTDLDQVQRNEFQMNLKQMFFAALGRQLVNVQMQPQPQIVFFPPRPRGTDEVVVEAQVVHPQRFPIRLSFRFHREPHGWQVFDVSTNGMSAVAFYRQYFQRHGQAPVHALSPY